MDGEAVASWEEEDGEEPRGGATGSVLTPLDLSEWSSRNFPQTLCLESSGGIIMFIKQIKSCLIYGALLMQISNTNA